MSLHVQCAECRAFALINCICPPVPEETSRPAHLDSCRAGDLGAQVKCLPDAGCCQQDHHHEQAAAACPQGHGACPTPGSCGVHGRREGPCPGGHCGMGVPGCTVCRVLVITAIDGQARLRAVSGG